MDESIVKQTNSPEQLVTSKPTVYQSNEIECCSEKEISDCEKNLKVKASKWPPALSGILLVVCCMLLLALDKKVPETAPLFTVLGLLPLLLAGMCFGQVFRNRPLYEIDRRGITDHGLASRGYGLIEWQNIQRVKTIEQEGAASLLIKVDNFTDLLKRRNLYFRPALWLIGMLCAKFGGEIALTMTSCNQPQSAILEHILHFSGKNESDLMA
jgi:hypothetical protein